MRRCVPRLADEALGAGGAAASPPARVSRAFPDNRIRRFRPGLSDEERALGDSYAAEQLVTLYIGDRRILTVINSLRDEGYHVGAKTYSKAGFLIAKRKGVQDMIILLRDMQKRGIPFPIEVYIHLMELCMIVGMPHYCLRIKDALPRLGIEPCSVTILTLLKAFGAIQRSAALIGDPAPVHERATSLLSYAERAGYQIDAQLMTAALGSAASYSEAAPLLEKMRELGVMDLVAYGVLFKTAGQWDEGPDYFDEFLVGMKEDGVVPDVRIYGAMVWGYKQRYDLERLVGCFREMCSRFPARVWLRDKQLITQVIQALPPFVACGNRSALRAAEAAFKDAVSRGPSGKPTASRQTAGAMAQVLGAAAYSVAMSPLQPAQEWAGENPNPAVLSEEARGLLQQFASSFPSRHVDDELRGIGLGGRFAQAHRQHLLQRAAAGLEAAEGPGGDGASRGPEDVTDSLHTSPGKGGVGAGQCGSAVGVRCA